MSKPACHSILSLSVVCIHLGTAIYLTFLEFRSVTSRYAAVSGGVTSESKARKMSILTKMRTKNSSDLKLRADFFLCFTSLLNSDL